MRGGHWGREAGGDIHCFFDRWDKMDCGSSVTNLLRLSEPQLTGGTGSFRSAVAPMDPLQKRA